MSEHHHDDGPPNRQALRAEALESLLRDKGLIQTQAIDAIIRHYERDVGPMNGAKVVAGAPAGPRSLNTKVSAAQPGWASERIGTGVGSGDTASLAASSDLIMLFTVMITRSSALNSSSTL